MELKLEDWKDFKDKEISFLVSIERKLEILREIGYDIDIEGYVVDGESKKRILLKDDEPVKFTEEGFAIFTGGSHHMVRNVADYSKLLAETGELKFTEKVD
jgi:hypothetical protein